jgi:hypothetical protein
VQAIFGNPLDHPPARLDLHEPDLSHLLSGRPPDSFWPTLGSLLGMLRTGGFETIRVVHNWPVHQDGPAIILAASASGSAT